MPDAFEDAARAEAEQRVMGSSLFAHTTRGLLVGMALWARDHLAEQEASDAEVEAAFQAFIWDSNKQAIRNELAQPDLRARPEPVNTRQSLRAALCAAARIRKEQR